jgi:hypothetical protein
LRSALSEIKDAVQKQTQAANEASQRHEQIQQNAELGRIGELHAVEHERREGSAYRKKNYGQQKLLNILTFLTFAAATLAAWGAWHYAGIAHDQLKQTMETNRIAQCATIASSLSAADNAYYSREEERAWVEVWQPGDTYLSISNPGKTVGRDVRVFVQTVSGEARFGPTTISPYTFAPFPFRFPVGIPADRILRGRISYADVFGVTHWVRFCYDFGTKSQTSPCKAGNEEDHNLENPPKATLPEECKQSSSPAP